MPASDRVVSIELTSAFDKASKVKIISYVNRTLMDQVIQRNYLPSMPSDTTTLRVHDLKVVKSTIKDNVIITAEQKDTLKRFLVEEDCIEETIADCYEPRHAILFLDENNKHVDYIEICLDCLGYQTSNNMYFSFCYEKSDKLRDLFRTFGITYFEEPRTNSHSNE